MKTYQIYKTSAAGAELIETTSAEWTEVQQKLKELNRTQGGGYWAKKVENVSTYTVEDALYVDGSAQGNPGKGGYQIVQGIALTQEKKTICRRMTENLHTNNFYELYAILEGIKMAIDLKYTLIYSDSSIALAWSLGNNCEASREVESIQNMRVQIKKLLSLHPAIVLKKWDTARFGEIPADFGRK